jgi:putative methionine-R-sulfoxide reductase with GAF domain
LSTAVKSDYIFELYSALDGYVWVGSNAGIYKIDPGTLKIDPLTSDPLLQQVSGMRVIHFLEDGRGNMWISTFRGLYRYNKSKNRLDHYTTKEGLASNQCYNMALDKQGTLYVGTVQGFTTITNGKITNYDRSNGLKYDYCEGIVAGDDGKMWLANTKCIIRFDPVTKKMQYFDENSGLSTEGFRFGAVKGTKNGELFWGSRKGINYFYPLQLINHPADIALNIYQAETADSTFYFGNNNAISLRYTNNSITFRFAAINLKGSKNIQYQYMLEGYDKDWQNGMDIRQVRYSSLPAGYYKFKIRASNDRVNWVNAPDAVQMRIIPPLWQRWWFLGALLAAVTGIIYWIFANRNKKIEEQKEEIEREQAITYFASSLSDQQTEETILWDVAKNCIGRLHFEDCVIYLLDEEKNILVQKAAHGRKSPREFEITKPIGIEVGKGIVGSVAFSGRAEIIDDTSSEPRYIVDDERRLSEISVPIGMTARSWG